MDTLLSLLAVILTFVFLFAGMGLIALICKIFKRPSQGYGGGTSGIDGLD